MKIISRSEVLWLSFVAFVAGVLGGAGLTLLAQSDLSVSLPVDTGSVVHVYVDNLPPLATSTQSMGGDPCQVNTLASQEVCSLQKNVAK